MLIMTQNKYTMIMISYKLCAGLHLTDFKT